MSEKDWIAGNQAAYRSVLSECVRRLPTADRGQYGWVTERADVVLLLRRLCEDYGDNDWPDDLNLADVIEKHIRWDRMEGE